SVASRVEISPQEIIARLHKDHTPLDCSRELLFTLRSKDFQLKDFIQACKDCKMTECANYLQAVLEPHANETNNKTKEETSEDIKKSFQKLVNDRVSQFRFLNLPVSVQPHRFFTLKMFSHNNTAVSSMCSSSIPQSFDSRRFVTVTPLQLLSKNNND